MSALSTLDIIGIWISIFMTIAILSYLYDDNPFYKLAEHLFVGISIGYVVVIQYHDTLKPNVIDRLADVALGPSRFVYLIPLALVVFLFLGPWKRVAWLGRLSIAFVVGIFAGQQITAIASADLVAQVAATLASVGDFTTRAAVSEGGATSFVADHAGEALGLVVLVGGMTSALVYFFFSVEHRGPLRPVARAGVWVLMVGFGAAFGYTVQGRISLAIGRAMDVLGIARSAADEARVHSKLVACIAVALIFGSIVLLERRKRGREPRP